MKEGLVNQEESAPRGAFAVVVNDDATQLNLLSLLLRKAGLETRMFSDGEAALAAVSAWERASGDDSDAVPALIVTDLHMPGIDGWRLCRLLRSPDYAAFNRVPILVVSATYGGEEASLIAADLGADGFMSSQVDGARFIEKVQSLLRGEHVRERLRVLIVEDGKALSDVLKETFEKGGYHPETAATVEEAITKFGRSSYDLAVIDYRLPDGNGGRLLDLFRRERPGCTCLMMTADPDPRLALDWMKRGAAAFLRKPFDPEYLIEVCEKARRERTLLGVQDRLEERTRELRRSEERLRLALAGANLGTWDRHVPSGAVIVNERWAEMLGCSLDEIEPHVRAWESLLHPEDRPRVMKILQSHLDGLSYAYESEHRLRHKSGDWVWVLDKGRVIERDAQENPVRMCGTHMDITELKRTDEARRNSERQFESLFLESPVSIIIHDKDTGEILDANPSAVAAYGFSSIEELKANDFWADPPYSAEEALGWIRKTALEGPQRFEWLNRKRTGELLSEQVRLVPVSIGGVDRILATGIDITARRRAEEALRASEARYEEVISNISDIVWRYEVDDHGKCVDSYISTVADRILGLSEGTVGDSFEAFLSHVHPEDVPAVWKAMKEGLASRTRDASIEYRLCRGDGAVVWVRSHGSAYLQPNGHVVAFGTTADITELKRAGSRLKESETNFRNFFETMTDMIMVATPEGRILHCNAATERRLGYSAEELTAMHVADVHPKEERPEAERVFAAVLRGERDACPLPLVARGGEIIPVETRLWSGKWNERDCIFCMSKDLTAEREAQQRFESLFRNNPTPMALSDLPDRCFVDVNDAFLETLGYDVSEVIGKSTEELGLFPDPKQQALTADKLEHEGRVNGIELQVRRKDGKILDGLFSGEVLSAQGRQYLLTVMVDVTERKQMEKALRAAEETYRNIFLNSQIGLFRTHMDSGMLLEANNAHAVFLGYPDRASLFAEPFSIAEQYVNPADRMEMIRVLKARGELRNYEARFKRRDGSTFWMRYSARLVPDKGWIEGVSEDVTDFKRSEEMLRESENRFQAIFDHAAIGIAQVDSGSGRFTKVNRRFCEITGFSAEELSGMGFADITHPDDLSADLGNLSRLASGDLHSYVLDKRYIRKDGSVLWVRVTVSHLRGDRGRSGFHITVVEDIDELKQVGEALEKAKVFLDNMSDIAYRTDDRGNLVWVNSSVERVTGLLPEEVIGKSFTPLFIESDHASIRDVYKRTLMGESLENTLTFKSGLTCHFTSLPMRNDKGEIIGTFGVGRDITDRIIAENALKESEKRLEKAQVVAKIGSWEYDLSTGKVWGSEEAFRIYDIKRESEFLPLDEVESHIMDAKRVNQALVDLITKGDDYDIEFQIIKHGSQSLATIHSIAELVKDDQGNPVKVVGVIQDITDKKAREEENSKLLAQLQQAQKMESVGRLAGGVAHDFNNMLGVILGHIEMAMDEVIPSQAIYSDLLEIQKAAKRSADLTQQLLTFARKQTVSPEVLNLNDVVEDMLRMLKRLIGEDIEMGWNPGGGLWPVKMDRSQIHQMLANLCVNGRDAISGTGKIVMATQNAVFDEGSVPCREGSRHDEFVMISVSDDGCGMDEETVRKLFEPFFTTKGIGKGTGLGLSTVDGIVKQNEGFIDVFSKPGHGTRFEIYLPRYVGESASVQSGAEKESVPRGGENVLLVEDEEAMRETAKRVLERLGYRVIEADTPGKALKLAEEHAGEIDLLLTDLVMPEMNGKQLSERLLSHYPQLKVLFTSGYTADVIGHHVGLDRGVPFLRKPFSIQELAGKVREVLDQGE